MGHLLPALFAVALLGGCDLVQSNSISKTYSFDPEEFNKQFSGGGMLMQLDCTSNDGCRSLEAKDSSLTVSCDLKAQKCAAVADVRLAYGVTLASQNAFPSVAIQYGIRSVGLDKVVYWVFSNSLNLSTPPIDLYVAPDGPLTDDSQWTRLGSIMPLNPKSTSCGDDKDQDGAAPTGTPVCRLPLNDAGKARLATLARDYLTKFQIIARTTLAIKAGGPLPSGTIDFFVRPTISIGIPQ
jgi:hypothetical protein